MKSLAPSPGLGVLPVAPLVGAWIEIHFCHLLTFLFLSLPSWERGLKLHCKEGSTPSLSSLPSWERGLKYPCQAQTDLCLPSLPSWERGLKYDRINVCLISGLVAPLVGAWIEIREINQERVHYPSLPSWERGLK